VAACRDSAAPASSIEERVITPVCRYVIEDRRRHDHLIVVWEVATTQWGMPLGLVAAGVVLSVASRHEVLSMPRGVFIGAVVFVATVAVAQVAGRVLFALGLRPRRVPALLN
jgi:hypothetical protein